MPISLPGRQRGKISVSCGSRFGRNACRCGRLCRRSSRTGCGSMSWTGRRRNRTSTRRSPCSSKSNKTFSISAILPKCDPSCAAWKITPRSRRCGSNISSIDGSRGRRRCAGGRKSRTSTRTWTSCAAASKRLKNDTSFCLRSACSSGVTRWTPRSGDTFSRRRPRSCSMRREGC